MTKGDVYSLLVILIAISILCLFVAESESSAVRASFEYNLIIETTDAY